MSNPAVQHHTFTIERTFAKPVAKVFAAFADAQRKRRWFGESANHDVEQFEMHFQPGGREQASYRLRAGTAFPGVVIQREGVFLDIVPGQRIVAAATMAFQGKPISASLETFEFEDAAGGTRFTFTHQAAFFEGADGPQMREQGWQQLLGQLDEELARGGQG